MTEFFKWWQAADIAAQATVVGAIVAILALLWAIFSYFRPRNQKQKANKVVAEGGSVAAGGNIKRSSISIDHSVNER